ncbi:hypothetical protein [Salimicrobium flavidum]|uniref:hypothetical protein n=1 Tax=Salimicrobium flavidum TaxID=570947 RepID=UPI000971109C|nr:hypothetical protein [Salimicrobium flavidum]
MTKDNFLRFVTIGTVLSVMGFILLIFSSNLGIYRADDWLMNEGGTNRDMFLIRAEGYINAFMVFGAICLSIGFFTLILAYFIKVMFTKEQ